VPYGGRQDARLEPKYIQPRNRQQQKPPQNPTFPIDQFLGLGLILKSAGSALQSMELTRYSLPSLRLLLYAESRLLGGTMKLWCLVLSLHLVMPVMPIVLPASSSVAVSVSVPPAAAREPQQAQHMHECDFNPLVANLQRASQAAMTRSARAKMKQQLLQWSVSSKDASALACMQFILRGLCSLK
jgi:hypothetical protein